MASFRAWSCACHYQTGGPLKSQTLNGVPSAADADQASTYGWPWLLNSLKTFQIDVFPLCMGKKNFKERIINFKIADLKTINTENQCHDYYQLHFLKRQYQGQEQTGIFGFWEWKPIWQETRPLGTVYVDQNSESGIFPSFTSINN